MSEDSDQLIQLTAEVPSDLGGQRLDQVAAQLFDEYSRSRLTAWIKEGRLTVDDAVLRPKDVVHGGAMLSLQAEQEAQGEWVAQDIPLNIVYEDGSQRSNRRVPSELLGGLDGDEPARGFIMEQDREIAEKSGRPPLAIKSIERVGAKKK